jgi:hypothetical protein
MDFTEDGLPVTAERHADGKFHIFGSLIAAPLSCQESVGHMCGLSCGFIACHSNYCIIGPTPRYVSGTCCGDPTHVDNFGKDDFEDDILDALEMHRKILTNWAGANGLRSYYCTSVQQHWSLSWDFPRRP